LWTTSEEDLKPCESLNYGVGGSTIADQQRFLQRIAVPLRPESLVVYAGSNDMTGARFGSKRGTLVAAGVLDYLDSVRDALPECRILYVSITQAPVRVRAHHEIRLANAIIRRGIGSRQGMEFVDTDAAILRAQGTDGDLFEADRLHLNASGYRVFASVIRSALLGG